MYLNDLVPLFFRYLYVANNIFTSMSIFEIEDDNKLLILQVSELFLIIFYLLSFYIPTTNEIWDGGWGVILESAEGWSVGEMLCLKLLLQF